MTFTRGILVLLCFGYPTPTAAGDKCYALALSGGGDKGAFEAGVIKGLVERIPQMERKWNVITGISAGSIGASAGALFNLGDEVAMAEWMVERIPAFTKANVFKQWFPFGVLEGLSKNGLLDTEPLYFTMLKELGSRHLGNRNVTIGATDDTTGRLVLFSERDIIAASHLSWKLAAAKWASYVRASSAIPGLFQSVKVDGRVLSDGGVRLGIDVFSAVARCRDVVENDEDIVVDIITCESLNLKPWDQRKDDTSVDLFLRARWLESYDSQMASILDACLAYPNVTFRYYVEPPASGLPSNGLNFNATQMQEMVHIGLEQARKVQPGAACKTAEYNRPSRRWPHASSRDHGTILV